MGSCRVPNLYLMEHPAVLLPNRSPHLRDVFHHDMQRIGRLLSGWRPAYRDNFVEIASHLDLAGWMADHPGRLALDLETDKSGQVDMVGLAASAEDACLLHLPDPEGLSLLLASLTGREVIVHYGEGLELPWLLSIYGDDDIPFTVHDLHKLFHAWDPEYAKAGRGEEEKNRERAVSRKDLYGGSGALAFIQSLFSWRPYHKHLMHVAVESGDRALKARYCMFDCVVEWECFQRIEDRLRAEQPQALEAYLRDAVPLLPIMARMSREGFAGDRELFRRRRDELKELAKSQAAAAIAQYGDQIKPKGKKAKTLISMHGLKAMLAAQGVKMPMERRANGTKSPSLNREARQKLFAGKPELAALDAYFETQDRISDFYKDGVFGRDGRCYPHWSGYEASWRWRCTHPNLTQWPEEDRDVFVADPGCVLVQFDTSAGEYRWFAGESQDPALLKVFADYDASHDTRQHPHVVNTSILFAVSVDEAARYKGSSDPDEKAKYTFSKNYIYRLLYSYDGGIDELRATAAKAGLKFSRRDIQEFDRIWFAKFPVAKTYRERHATAVFRSRIVVCREWGYTRRIHIQDDSKIKNIALNHVEQAGIAGIVNRTVREIWEAYRLAPRANSHDGLLYNCPQILLAEFVPFGVASLQQPLRTLGGIVIPVDTKTGPVYGSSMKEYKA